MNEIETAAILVGLFVARIGFPLALTVLFGMLMNRLMNRGILSE